MSEHPIGQLTLSTVNLSADGARITPGQNTTGEYVTEATALSALQALAGLPVIEITGADAKIYLASGHCKIAVENDHGKLFAALVPEAVNTAAERTPKEIIEWLTGSPPPATAEAVDAADDEVLAGPSGGWRKWFNSIRTVGILAVVAAVMAYINFAPATPAGVEVIRDGAKISSIHAQINGRYGVQPATILVLNNGHLTGLGSTAHSKDGQPLFEQNYRFGLRAQQVVVMLDNGGLLETQPDGSLKFMDSIYPRHAK